MHGKYHDLQEDLPPDARARRSRSARRREAAMPLDALRRSCGVTQAELARRMGTGQANVSKLERRADMHVSTLRALIRALGGELEVVARFPDGGVRITRLEAGREADPPQRLSSRTGIP